MVTNEGIPDVFQGERKSMVRTVVWAKLHLTICLGSPFTVFALQKSGHPFASQCLKPKGQPQKKTQLVWAISSQANNAILCVENLGERLINLVGKKSIGKERLLQLLHCIMV